MKVGITLPQFRDDVEAAVAVARSAEEAGLDGVFVFDHLWAIGKPGAPAIHSFTLLGALAAETQRVDVGTLVARVGLVPDAVLVNQFQSLQRIAGGRVVAGIGAGDAMSRDENEAFAVPYERAAVRLARVDNVVRLVRERGMTAWVGGRSAATLSIAVANEVPLNVWNPTPEELTSRAAAVELTVGMTVRQGDDLPGRLRGLADVGVTYAVLAPVEWEWRDAVAAIASAGAGAGR